jgi:hypothetical protein
MHIFYRGQILFLCFLIALGGIAAASPTGTVTLDWIANADDKVVGYNVYYGMVGQAEVKSDFVQETTVTLDGLDVGATYFFHVTALSAIGLESEPSETITHTIPESLPDIVNESPMVHAGPDQTISLPSSASLAGRVEDDGLPNPPGRVATHWSFISGPGNVAFENAAALSTTASFSKAGTYVLRLTADDGEFTATDDISIFVNPNPNAPPSVFAGVDQAIANSSPAILNGLVQDDGLPNPPGMVAIRWSAISGPGNVDFADAEATSTTASFSKPGTYVLRLTAHDGELSGSDEVTIVVERINNAKKPKENSQFQTVQAASETITLSSSPDEWGSREAIPETASKVDAVQLSIQRGGPGKETVLRWKGESGQNFVIETSSNLLNWQGLSTSFQEIIPGSYESRLLPEAGFARFYRLRRLPVR